MGIGLLRSSLNVQTNNLFQYPTFTPTDASFLKAILSRKLLKGVGLKRRRIPVAHNSYMYAANTVKVVLLFKATTYSMIY